MIIPRSPESFADAENRLRELGFIVEHTDNVTTYKLEHDAFIVLADPREEGRIKFRVARNPTFQKRVRSKQRQDFFEISDRLKRNLSERFKQRLDLACSRFPATRKNNLDGRDAGLR